MDEQPGNGTPLAGGKVELGDVVVVHSPAGAELEYEIVGIVEDDEKKTYAVGYSEAEDEFLVTDEFGAVVADSSLAQEILDDFLVFAEESAQEE